MIFQKTILILAIIIPLLAIFNHASAQKKHAVYNEKFKYKIRWLGMNVGTIEMRTKTDEKQGLLKSYASVRSFETLQKVYYIGGYFGTHWDYKQRRSNYAYEEIYQGTRYYKRSFYFNKDWVNVQKKSIKLDERSYPHTGPRKVKYNRKINIYAKGYQDLLGAFYYMRTMGKEPKPGEVEYLHTLPAGKKSTLILQVLGKEKIKNPFLGKVATIHVKTALKKGKSSGGGDLFFNTKSHIDMWITDDNKFIPVLMKTKVDYLGTVYIRLARYQNLN